MYLILDEKGTLLEFKPSRNFEPILPPSEFLGKSIEEVLPAELAEESRLRMRAGFYDSP